MPEKWSLREGILDIFGLKGCRIGDSIFLGYHEDRLIASEFTPLSQSMAYTIWHISKDLGADKIAYVGINPYIAFQLFFEKALTLEALEAAVDEDDYLMVQVPFGGNLRSVVIRENPPKSTIYYDLNWDVLYP